MSKKKVCSAETAAKLEESRRRDVFENPLDPSQEKDVNMANALKWHSGGWNKGDCYSRAGVGKKSFWRWNLLQWNLSNCCGICFTIILNTSIS